jgi:hypothetical protein
MEVLLNMSNDFFDTDILVPDGGMEGSEDSENAMGESTEVVPTPPAPNPKAGKGNQVVITGNPGGVILPDLTKALDGVDGIIVGDMGMKIARVPIEKYKGSTQKVDRVGFVTNQVIGVKYHFFDKIGAILCFGKKCCEVGGMPTVRYLFPIVLYSTDNEGNIVGKKLELRMLSAADELYKNIVQINRTYANVGGISAIDCYISCSDDHYQKLTVSGIPGKAAWRQSKQAVQYVTEKWAQDAEFAYMAVARKMDEATFLAQLDGAGDSGASSAPQRFDPKNTNLTNFFDDDK